MNIIKNAFKVIFQLRSSGPKNYLILFARFGNFFQNSFAIIDGCVILNSPKPSSMTVLSDTKIMKSVW